MYFHQVVWCSKLEKLEKKPPMCSHFLPKWATEYMKGNNHSKKLNHLQHVMKKMV